MSSPYSPQTGATFWLTGLSGAGKSTLAEAVKKYMDTALGDDKKVFILDGDIIRTGLNKGLSFSACPDALSSSLSSAPTPRTETSPRHSTKMLASSLSNATSPPPSRFAKHVMLRDSTRRLEL